MPAPGSSSALDPVADAEHEHAFDALNTLLVTVLLMVCVAIAYARRRYRWWAFVPETAVALVVGLGIGGLMRRSHAETEEELRVFRFRPEVFFFTLLPAILFNAGYTVRKKNFFSNIVPILLWAVVGTVVSTCLIGTALLHLGRAGVIPGYHLVDAFEPFLYGAAISAVDPVATLSILGVRSLDADETLYSLLFGESVLNDAIAVVLFRTFASVRQSGALDSTASHWSMLAAGLMTFLGIAAASVATGVGVGVGCCLLFKNTQLSRHLSPKHELCLLALTAYGAYATAEACHLSGIMAIFFCSVVLSHYNSYNLSDRARAAAGHAFDACGTIAEFSVFLYMGAGAGAGEFSHYNGALVGWVLALCLLARAAHVFPLSAVANRVAASGPDAPGAVPCRMQAVVWFAGMRGAVAFSLVMLMPEQRDLYATTTLCVVLITSVVFGGLTEPLLAATGLRGAGGGVRGAAAAAAAATCSPSSGKASADKGSGSDEGGSDLSEGGSEDDLLGSGGSDDGGDGDDDAELAPLWSHEDAPGRRRTTVSPTRRRQRRARRRRRHADADGDHGGSMHARWRSIDDGWLKPMLGGGARVGAGGGGVVMTV